MGIGISGPPGPFRLELENIELRRFFENTVPPPKYAWSLGEHKRLPDETEAEWESRLARLQEPTGIPGINLSSAVFSGAPSTDRWGNFTDLHKQPQQPREAGEPEDSDPEIHDWSRVSWKP